MQGVQLTTNENELILGWGSPRFGVEAAPLAAELKDVALLISIEPENAFGAKDFCRHLSHQKVLKFSQIEGAIALKQIGRAHV